MLGISIYPEHQSVSELKNYIDESSKLGYKRIFSSLLEVNDDNYNKIVPKFKEIIDYSRQKGFEFILDVNPAIFEYLNISFDNLKFFSDLNCTGIRLDDLMGAKVIADMTHNEFELDIEINASNSKELINEILEFKPIKKRLISCHNFYPQQYSGLDFDYFYKLTKELKKNNIRTAAFISANKQNAIYGPWPINDGICTLESHRNLPIHTQAKLLFATGLIDDVLIGNACATHEELKKVATTNYDIIELDVKFNDNVTEVEKEIALKFKHFRRGDITPFMVRSTFSRVAYKEYDFPIHDNNSNLEFGDIIVGNNEFGNYKGELHVILKSLNKDVRKNKIGEVAKYDLELLSYVDSWQRFIFKEK